MGAVVGVHPGERTIRIIFAGSHQPHVGQVIKIYHTFLTGNECVGAAEVARINQYDVIARPLGNLKFTTVSKGDQVFFQVIPAENTSLTVYDPTEFTVPEPVDHRTAAPKSNPMKAIMSAGSHLLGR